MSSELLEKSIGVSAAVGPAAWFGSPSRRASSTPPPAPSVEPGSPDEPGFSVEPPIGWLRAVAPFWLAALALVGLAAGALGSPLGAVLAHLLPVVVVFRVWHWVLHRPWGGRLAGLHRVHHVELCPPEALSSAGYQSEGGIAQELALGLASAGVFGLSALLGTSGHSLAVAAGAALLVLWAGGSLHQAMHVEGHWLGRWRWFRDMQALHWLHHLDQACNLGIVESALDALAGTLRRR